MPPNTDAKPAAKPSKRTWLDGLPEYLAKMPADALYTRDEVLGSLHDRGVDINEGTLVSLEKANVLPRPVIRYRDGAPRALYPPWSVDAIEYLRQLQAKGMTRAQIAPLMDPHKLSEQIWSDPIAAPLTIVRDELLDVARILGLDVAAIRIQFLDDDGNVLDRGEHELPVPGEWRFK